MYLTIHISDEDVEVIRRTSLTIDEMDNTLMGRVYCAIADAAEKVKPVDKNVYFNLSAGLEVVRDYAIPIRG